MALTIKKSMDISNFWESWLLVREMVADEYDAVRGREGFYELELVLIFRDCEELLEPTGGYGQQVGYDQVMTPEERKERDALVERIRAQVKLAEHDTWDPRISATTPSGGAVTPAPWDPSVSETAPSGSAEAEEKRVLWLEKIDEAT